MMKQNEPLSVCELMASGQVMFGAGGSNLAIAASLR